MSKKTIYPSWFARLVGETCHYIELSDESLTLYPKDVRQDSQTFHINDLIGPPELMPRIWRATLILETKNQQVKVRGVPKDSDISFKSWFEDGWLLLQGTQYFFIYKRLLARQYEKLAPLIMAALKEIDTLLHKGYLRTSRWLKIQGIAKEARALFGEPPEEDQVSKEAYDAFVRIHHLANMDEGDLKSLRQAYIQDCLQHYASLFDEIESNPLTDKQRNACIVDEDNNLVLAGAGTGKTSTMIGRAAFLIKSGQAAPRDILMLAFAKKAAEEMRERLQDRLGIQGVTASTFHALGLQIVSEVERERPSISKLAEDEKLLANFIDSIFQEFLKDTDYRKKAIKYFEHYLFPEVNPFEFKTEGEYYAYIEANEIRTFKGEKVKSYEECLIANYLYKMGVEYEYEAPYTVNTKTVQYKAYKPDFFLPHYDIYIEHFGIDRELNTAPYIDRSSYLEGMKWKRALHRQHQTVLIETFHYEQTEGCLISNLKQKLEAAHVEFLPLSEEQVLETLKEFGVISEFSGLLAQMLKLYKSNWMSDIQLEDKVKNSAHPQQMNAAFALLQPIIDRYEKELKEKGEIDFSDMIGKALDYIQSNRFSSPWKFILVDEFQDISEPRARLIKALCNQVPEASLFCVGDDWQAIYRFAGSDISFTTNFESYFGPTQITALDKTFRFNNSICEIASRFVMQNPAQIQKHLKTHYLVDKPAVSILRQRKLPQPQSDQENPLFRVLSRIADIAKEGSSVFIIARYNFHLPEILKELKRQFPSLELQALTMHASKGKEADYVIIDELVCGKHGFPSEKITHPLLEALLPTKEDYPNAEERRLFYVAMTRAKQRAYLITDMAKASSFVSELIGQKYTIELNEFEIKLSQARFQDLYCIECISGSLVHRTSRYGAFYGCTHYPYCKHLETGCKECGEPMKRISRFRVCIDEKCQGWVPLCLRCGGDMILRQGWNGQFWGCQNYKGTEEGSCRHTEEQIVYPQVLQEVLH